MSCDQPGQPRRVPANSEGLEMVRRERRSALARGSSARALPSPPTPGSALFVQKS